MRSNTKANVPQQFENLYKIFSSSRFLNKEGLGGELPFFIHSFDIRDLAEVDVQVQSLKKRLENNGIEIFQIDLYALCLDLLKRENQFETIIAQESRLPKQRLMRAISGPLNVERNIIPEIHRRLAERASKIVFLTGIGAAFPMIRSHTVLNNIQTLVDNLPLVMFFPGTFNNKTLTLFDRIKDDNYYRAHNLNDYKF